MLVAKENALKVLALNEGDLCDTSNNFNDCTFHNGSLFCDRLTTACADIHAGCSGIGAIRLLGDNPSKGMVLLVIFLLTMLLTNSMMNTSTALLVTPLFVPIAF